MADQLDITAANLVERFMEVLDQAKAAATRSVLSGTISCKRCASLVLEENAGRHARWHDTLHPVIAWSGADAEPAAESAGDQPAGGE